jgi:urea-proton symporter
MKILWPIPMYGSGYVFGKPFFTGWIVVTFIWGFFGAITITFVPLRESKDEISLFFRVLFGGETVLKGGLQRQSVTEVVQNPTKEA